MSEENSQISVPDEVIMDKIYIVRNEKVMIDNDLAKLFKYLKKFITLQDEPRKQVGFKVDKNSQQN